MQNGYDDLYSLLHFLRYNTFGDYYWWNNYINKNDDKAEAGEILMEVLGPLTLRRTKEQKYQNGENILHLPPKTIKNEIVKFTIEERRIYDFCFKKTNNHFNSIVDEGGLDKNFVHVF